MWWAFERIAERRIADALAVAKDVKEEQALEG